MCLPFGSLFTGCGTYFFLSGLHHVHLLVENAASFAAVGCLPLPMQFSVLMMSCDGFHVSLADIFVAQFGSTGASLARGEFNTEDVFGYAPMLHPSHRAELSTSALPDQCEDRRRPARSSW